MSSRDAVKRARKAQSLLVTVDELRALATDPSPRVRKAVAQNGKTPEVELIRLTKSRDTDVAVAAAMNPSLPLMARFDIAKRSRVREVLTAVVDGAPAHSRSSLNRAIVARGDDLKQVVEQAAVISKEHSLLAAEAKHVATMPPRLAQLARVKLPAVQAAAARNEKTPASALEGLAHNSEQSVRLGVAANKSTPIDLRRYFMREEPDKKVVTEAIASARPKEREALRHLAATSSKHLDIRAGWQKHLPTPAAQPKKPSDSKDRPLCPTPDKRRYDARGRALGAAFGTAVAFEKAARVYRCPCGAYHVTTKVRKAKRSS
jgi:hypothetical protein